MVCNNEDCCKLFALCLSDILFLKWCLSDIEHGSAAAREAHPVCSGVRQARGIRLGVL
jgi:hypothetical protein